MKFVSRACRALADLIPDTYVEDDADIQVWSLWALSAPDA